jgi:hypothetical protein
MTQNRQKIADIKLKVEPGPEPAPIQVAKTKITATPAPTPGVTPSRAVSRSSVSWSCSGGFRDSWDCRGDGRLATIIDSRPARRNPPEE